MGLGFTPLGVNGAILLITVPQLLAAHHVPEAQIATITSIGLLPSTLCFLLGPLLDWRFSRRAYAVALSIVGAACAFGALLSIDDLPRLTVLLFSANLAISLVVAAVGGWFGNLVETERKGALSAWFNVANAGAFGIMAAIAMTLLRGLPYALGAGLFSGTILVVLPLFFRVPCPPADGRLASESIRDFSRDVLAITRKATVLWTLAIFLAPAAAFALTNTLGGLGRDFHTPEALVGLLGGAGSTIAGGVGSLLMPKFEKIIAPRPLYLLVGGVGALFTLGLVALPHTPTTFGLAMLSENFFQGAAFSVQFMIILKGIGRDNPLAATQFALLNAASSLPLIYMQYIDGHAYERLGGVNGSYLADALISGAFCLFLGVVLWGFRRAIGRADQAAEGPAGGPADAVAATARGAA
jgi:PAT family beta-lactamase induction signal transducer AmpG